MGKKKELPAVVSTAVSVLENINLSAVCKSTSTKPEQLVELALESVALECKHEVDVIEGSYEKKRDELNELRKKLYESAKADVTAYFATAFKPLSDMLANIGCDEKLADIDVDVATNDNDSDVKGYRIISKSAKRMDQFFGFCRHGNSVFIDIYNKIDHKKMLSAKTNELRTAVKAAWDEKENLRKAVEEVKKKLHKIYDRKEQAVLKLKLNAISSLPDGQSAIDVVERLKEFFKTGIDSI